MKKIVLLTLLFPILLASCKKEVSTEFYPIKDYSYVGILKSGVRKTVKDSKQGAIDKKNKTILPNAYINVGVVGDKIVYLKEKKMGITSLTGKNLLKNEYRYIYPIQENYLIKDKNKEKFGIIDSSEKIIVSPIYDSITPFKEDMAIVISDKKYGVIDKSGKEIVAPQYDYIQEYSNGMAMIITQGKKAGFLNKSGVEVFDDIFTYTEPFEGESTMVVIDKEFGVVNKEGKYLIGLQPERINLLGNDLYSIKENNKVYLIEMTGKKISNQGYDNIGGKIEELISVSLEDKFGYINSKGKEIIPIRYTELGEVRNGLIIAKDEVTQKFGVINLKNKYVVEAKYSYILSRTEDLFIVGDENSKEGVVNKEGEIILPLEYTNLEFKYDNLVVGDNKQGDYKYIQINEKGSVVLDVNPEEIIDYNNNEIVTQNKLGTKIYIINGEN